MHLRRSAVESRSGQRQVPATEQSRQPEQLQAKSPAWQRSVAEAKAFGQLPVSKRTRCFTQTTCSESVNSFCYPNANCNFHHPFRQYDHGIARASARRRSLEKKPLLQWAAQRNSTRVGGRSHRANCRRWSLPMLLTCLPKHMHIGMSMDTRLCTNASALI